MKNDKRISNDANSFNMKFTLNNETVGIHSFIYCSTYLKDEDFDYALLKLQTPIENEGKFLSYQSTVDSDLYSHKGKKLKKVKIVGPKTDKLVFDKGRIQTFDKRLINYQISTDCGQSGGPVVAKIHGHYVIIGIHFRGVRYSHGNVINSAVRINEEVKTIIDRWKLRL